MNELKTFYITQLDIPLELKEGIPITISKKATDTRYDFKQEPLAISIYDNCEGKGIARMKARITVLILEINDCVKQYQGWTMGEYEYLKHYIEFEPFQE